MRLKSRIETSQETSYNGRLTIYLLTDELKIKGWRRFNTFSHEEILMLSNKTQIFQQLPHKKNVGFHLQELYIQISYLISKLRSIKIKKIIVYLNDVMFLQFQRLETILCDILFAS